MRDPDEINQKLWARKKLKLRRLKNEKKKIKKEYFKHKDNLQAGGGEVQVDEKKQ